MELWQVIRQTYPELTEENFGPVDADIVLKDDNDGLGAYIAKWDYSKPIPEGLSLGKP